MNREDKNKIINDLSEKISANPNFYLTDISGLNAEQTYMLRKLCFENDVEMLVVKNTLLEKAIERINKEDRFGEIFSVLKGNTSLMFTTKSNSPAKIIKKFRQQNNKPVLKAAFIEESLYIGDNQLDNLINIKSREELIGDIIMLLQSPIRNVLSGLQSGGNKIAGLVKELSNR